MWIWAAVSAVILVILDQGTKLLALSSLKPIGSCTVIDGILDFTFVENRGVAFGMLSGKRWIILLITVVIAAGVIWYYKSLPRTREYRPVRWSLVLILAGAVGNIIDRLFRGYVVDFFEFTFFNWPVFNVADIYVVVGVIILMIMVLFVIKDDEKKKDEN